MVKCLKCKKQANFNNEGEKKALFCGDHKQPNMINVLEKRKCLLCKKIPSFNKEGENIGIYCGDHKQLNMINVFKKRMCLLCKKQPNFNKEGEKIGIYCGDHKQPNMINVLEKRKCLLCKKIPHFNKEGEKIGIYCGDHKQPNMVNVLKNRKCLLCNKQPYFNKDGEKIGIYCEDHKQPNMVNVLSKKCLLCKKIPSFNMEGKTKGIYCGDHKHQDMIDVLHKTCKTHLCYTHVSNKQYEGYCLRCFIHTFPDKPVSRNYKTKEQNVVANIKKIYPDFTWIEDKTIEGGCSLYRPDLKVDLGTHILITEIDENKHSSYECSCENKRIMEISQDVGHRPIIFIRFNPDSYNDIDGKKITSCWGVNKLGIMTIKQSKQKEWIERINILNSQIQYWVDNKPDKTIEVVELFY